MTIQTRLHLEIQAQPDDFTCGPTCLQGVYDYHGDTIGLADVIRETRQLEGGGTFGVLLGCHALRRGYKATIYSYNLRVFDPTWFDMGRKELIARMRAQHAFKGGKRLGILTDGYAEFLSSGGKVRLEDLTAGLIRKFLNRGIPILTGLSATYLYRTAREYGPNDDYDDIRGKPSGHFVVLCGYDRVQRTVLVADPMYPNPMADSHYYELKIDRVMGAILLGILTHDANLLIIQPRASHKTTQADG